MPREDVEVVRQPIALTERSGRRLEERLALRFPRAFAFIAGAVWGLPRRSRLRQAFFRRAAISGWEAFNRGDLEVAFALYDEDVETTVDPRLASVGLGNTRGREARVALQRGVLAEFREFRFLSDQLIDLGAARLAMVGHMKGSGLQSGAAFDADWAVILTISAGRVIREQVFLDRAEAAEAAGALL
jgi:ketosteroid isomerase-like protein